MKLANFEIGGRFRIIIGEPSTRGLTNRRGLTVILNWIEQLKGGKWTSLNWIMKSYSMSSYVELNWLVIIICWHRYLNRIIRNKECMSLAETCCRDRSALTCTCITKQTLLYIYMCMYYLILLQIYLVDVQYENKVCYLEKYIKFLAWTPKLELALIKIV